MSVAARAAKRWARAARSPPILHQSDPFRTAGRFGYNARGWSGSTSSVPSWLQQPLGIRSTPATQPGPYESYGRAKLTLTHPPHSFETASKLDFGQSGCVAEG